MKMYVVARDGQVLTLYEHEGAWAYDVVSRDGLFKTVYLPPVTTTEAKKLALDYATERCGGVEWTVCDPW